MKSKRVLFVLGAGSSVTYGFPARKKPRPNDMRIPLKRATCSENKKPLSYSTNPIIQTMSWWLYSVNSDLLLSL